jgi:hypothetical protein
MQATPTVRSLVCLTILILSTSIYFLTRPQLLCRR